MINTFPFFNNYHSMKMYCNRQRKIFLKPSGSIIRFKRNKRVSLIIKKCNKNNCTKLYNYKTIDKTKLHHRHRQIKLYLKIKSIGGNHER